MFGRRDTQKHSHKNRVQSRGFTLIELLVVVAIIALLSEIVLASLQNGDGEGQKCQAGGDGEAVSHRAEAYCQRRKKLAYFH